MFNADWSECRAFFSSLMLFLPPPGWLAQLVECRQCGRSRVRAPDWTNTQGLKITEENVLPL